jgi:hypothetical protein
MRAAERLYLVERNILTLYRLIIVAGLADLVVIAVVAWLVLR